MESLKLFWLGHPLVELKGRTIKLETRKAAALFVYLSLNPGRCPREVLATMFWQEANQQKALANLRRTLSSLNASLPGWIEADRETIKLKRNNKLWVDVEAFHQLLSQLKDHHHSDNEVCDECLSTLEKAVELYRGDFMEGLNLTDTPTFDDWQFFQRDGLRQEFADVLQRLSFGHSERGQWDQAIIHARRWVAMDRLHEPACRALMDLYARSGQRAAALHQYEELARLLNEQMSQEPDEETRRLVEQIRGREEAKPGAESPGTTTSFPLLKTKLYIPTVPDSVVARSYLLERLGEAKKKVLTIVSAPAGFGKTTLLAEWIAQTPLPVAWLSLDHGDNDPYRFLSYVIAAVASIHEEAGLEAQQIMRSPQLAPLHVILASLLNDLGKVAVPYMLVMDDYQFITEHAVHEAMAYLLDHVPSNMHIVISTRADPPLQLGRLRAHGQMMELRSQDLRFTSEEATKFLNDVMRLGLSADDIEALETRTENWVVGLKMAALSLKEHANASEFIRAFSGSHRYVLDYLVEEVLRRQPAHIQTFLLETSILDKLSGSLCDAVLSERWNPSGEHSQAILEYLERSNLFLIPLDENKHWYRYHHLFADLLRSRLGQYHPGTVSRLNTQAAEWFERNGLYPEAVAHLILARDFQRAAGLIEQSTLTLLANNELSIYLSWLDSIPVDVIQSHPWLNIYKAWVFSRLGKLDQVEPLLQTAEDDIIINPQNIDKEEMTGCIALVRANVASLRGKISSVIEQSENARNLISGKNVIALDNVDFQLGYAYFSSGEFSKSRETWLRLVRSAMEKEDFHTFANVTSELANLDKLQGKLHQAFQLYGSSRKWLLENSAHPFVFTGVLEIGMADSLCEWNKLVEANQLLQEGIVHAREGGRPNTLCFGYFVQARLSQAQQNAAGVVSALREAERILSTHTLYPRSTGQLETANIRFWLSQGDSQTAFRWADEHQFGTFDFVHELEYITLSRVLITRKKMDEALRLLTRLAKAARGGQRIGRLIEILNIHALALQVLGRHEQALKMLETSLHLAKPEEYVRTFLDEGEPMLKLLKRLRTLELTPPLSDFVNRLLEAASPKSKANA